MCIMLYCGKLMNPLSSDTYKPCGPLRVGVRFGAKGLLHLKSRRTKRFMSPAFKLFSCLAYSSNLKITCSSETSVDFRRTARRYIVEDRALHNSHCAIPKSYVRSYSVVCQTCLPGNKAKPARKADNLTTIREPIV
jgi:hypothetical protein